MAPSYTPAAPAGDPVRPAEPAQGLRHLPAPRGPRHYGWFPDRIKDKTAVESKLATLTDRLADEQELEEEQDGVDTAGQVPLHEEWQQQAQLIAEKATELELVKAELTAEVEIVMKEEVMLRRLEAVVKGPEGVKELVTVWQMESGQEMALAVNEVRGLAPTSHLIASCYHHLSLPPLPPLPPPGPPHPRRGRGPARPDTHALHQGQQLF